MKAMALISALLLLASCGDYADEFADLLDKLGAEHPHQDMDAGMPDEGDAGTDPHGNMSTIEWVDWVSDDRSQSTVVGNIGNVEVRFMGDILSALLGADNEPNYWIPSIPYVSSLVTNPPITTDMIRLVGGPGHVYVLEFSQPVTDPVVAVVSIGRPGTAAFLDFNDPFNIVSYGPGPWGDGYLIQKAGDILEGQEGSGVIQFLGSFSRIEWTVPEVENWHGFTIGLEK